MAEQIAEATTIDATDAVTEPRNEAVEEIEARPSENGGDEVRNESDAGADGERDGDDDATARENAAERPGSEKSVEEAVPPTIQVEGADAESKEESGAVEEKELPEDDNAAEVTNVESLENLDAAAELPKGEDGVGAESGHDELFLEGQDAEGPIVSLGPPLSRTTSGVEVDGEITLEVPTLRPGTPNREEEAEDESRADDESRMEREFEEEVAEEEEVILVDRDELIRQYQEALLERDRLTLANNQLQNRLAEHFKRKKTDERQEVEKSVTDQEQRYVKCLGALEEHQFELNHIRNSYEALLAEMEERKQERQAKVTEATQDFAGFKRRIALEAVNSRSGKQMTEKDVDQYQAMEEKKEKEVVQVRLENIRLRHKLKKKETQLKQKEELAEGLHLIDFEQLKIENTTYSEKIEERNEDLMKLRKKITNTVQVLTHLKEKLQFVQAENAERRKELEQVDGVLAQKRDILSRTKQARDSLRIENVRSRQKCGLLGHESLLRDYEERKDEVEKLQSRVNNLKMRYAQLSFDSDGIRRKIEKAKQAEIF